MLCDLRDDVYSQEWKWREPWLISTQWTDARNYAGVWWRLWGDILAHSRDRGAREASWMENPRQSLRTSRTSERCSTFSRHMSDNLGHEIWARVQKRRLLYRFIFQHPWLWVSTSCLHTTLLCSRHHCLLCQTSPSKRNIPLLSRTFLPRHSTPPAPSRPTSPSMIHNLMPAPPPNSFSNLLLLQRRLISAPQALHLHHPRRPVHKSLQRTSCIQMSLVLTSVKLVWSRTVQLPFSPGSANAKSLKIWSSRCLSTLSIFDEPHLHFQPRFWARNWECTPSCSLSELPGVYWP